ncbi:MAG: 5-deoxy-glucuronate isomerase, partial [Oscillospiraceae bacterium]|nr:5-deoxy-glucuronate isomerase [Oscillospiraceae bacterium]
MREFGYPEFDENGVMRLCDDQGGMMQNIAVHRLVSYENEFFMPHEEMAIVLIEGDVTFTWDDGWGRKYADARRGSCIDDPAYCLHVPRGVEVSVYANGPERNRHEILVQSTENKEIFEPKLYTPENTRRETFGQGRFEGKAVRTVSTFFDYGSAPYSNMVCGEILIPQGGWSSYPP